MPSVYEIVTNKIIEKLEQGVIPWRKPWVNSAAVNWVSQKPYRGINTMLLDPGEYASRKQILNAGGWIKKEELKNYQIVVYWLWKDKIDKDTEEVIGRFVKPFYYKVWNINTQVTGLESKREEQIFDHDPVEEAENVIQGYSNGPSYSFNSGKAVYKPALDHINVPPMKDFKNVDEYYSTMFHEMVHSTGHKSRLNRIGVTKAVAFGDEVYSKEELVAEIGSAMLCGVAGVDSSTIDNSVSYIKSWLSALKNDKKLVVTAASQAQKASDLILGATYGS